MDVKYRKENYATLNRTLSGNLVLLNSDAYVQYIDPGGSARDVTLPAEGTGNHAFWLYNSADAAETLTVKNDASATIATLLPCSCNSRINSSLSSGKASAIK